MSVIPEQIQKSGESQTPDLKSRVLVLENLKGFAWAVILTLAATALRWIFDSTLIEKAPFAFYYVSVAFTAVSLRIAPILFALLLGAAAGQYLWVEPRFSLYVLDKAQGGQIVVYLLVGFLIALAIFVARVARIFDNMDGLHH